MRQDHLNDLAVLHQPLTISTTHRFEHLLNLLSVQPHLHPLHNFPELGLVQPPISRLNLFKQLTEVLQLTFSLGQFFSQQLVQVVFIAFLVV